jgi:hypothetical protein
MCSSFSSFVLMPSWQITLVTYCNKNVDIQFNAHEAFLEQHSSGDAQNLKIGKPNNFL